METTLKGKQTVATNVAIADFIGRLFSFNSSLKLHHWHVTGKASYSQHIALDQAIEDLLDVIDIVELVDVDACRRHIKEKWRLLALYRAVSKIDPEKQNIAYIFGKSSLK